MSTTENRLSLHSDQRAQEHAAQGTQVDLICIAAPAGAEALVDEPLNGQVLSVSGDYVVLIPIAGLVGVRTNLRATLAGGGTLSSSGPDELAKFNPRSDSIESAVVITAATGDGALVSGTLQTAVLAPTGGLYARLTLTKGGAGTAALTVAELTGI